MMPVLHARESLHRVNELLYVSQRQMPEDNAAEFVLELQALSARIPVDQLQPHPRSAHATHSGPLPYHADPNRPAAIKPTSMAEMVNLIGQSHSETAPA